MPSNESSTLRLTIRQSTVKAKLKTPTDEGVLVKSIDLTPEETQHLLEVVEAINQRLDSGVKPVSDQDIAKSYERRAKKSRPE